MIDRPSWLEYACELALSASLRSEDPHTKVGAAILNKAGETISTGYNGLMPGMEYPANFLLDQNRETKGALTIHAEYNAITRAKDKGHLLAVTISPCAHCAKDIAAEGIKHVVYITRYWRCDGKFKEIFDFYGVKHEQLSNAGLLRLMLIQSQKQELLQNIYANTLQETVSKR